MEISIHKLIGSGYEDGWFSNFKGRYRVFAGARNTKKSYTFLGFEIICKIFQNPNRNVIVIRNTLASNRDSTYSTLLKILNDLSLLRYFKINKSDMRIIRKSTGQVILFKGLDEPYKITSIRAEHGVMSDVYVEEAFEVDDYDKWRIIDSSFRLSDFEVEKYKVEQCQITFVLNTWNKNHWIYKHFFENRLEDDEAYLENNDYMIYSNPDEIIDYGKGLFLHKSTFRINEFRNKAIYDVAMAELKKTAPEIYKVEALGMWGTPNGATYPELNKELLINPSTLKDYSFIQFSFGIDTGFSNGEGKVLKTNRFRSATTLQFVGLTSDYSKLIAIDEYFHSNETQEKISEPNLALIIVETLMKWRNETYKWLLGNQTLLIYVDNADIGFRQMLEMRAKEKGAYYLMFIASTKLRIQTRVDFTRLMFAYKDFLLTTQCKNLYREMTNSMKGSKGEPRENFDDHAINAYEYAWSPLTTKIRRWKDFKQH